MNTILLYMLFCMNTTIYSGPGQKKHKNRYPYLDDIDGTSLYPI